MDALLFLWKRSFINKVKKALKKPVTYIYIVLFTLYIVMMGFSLKVLFENPMPVNVALILSVMAMMIIPGNIMAYAKRKGILFRNSDVHFLFPSPIAPKKILLFTLLKANVMKVLSSLLIVLAGIFIFRAPVLSMILYAVFSLFIHGSYETAMGLLLFGSERLEEKSRKILVFCSYAIWASLGIIALIIYLQHGLSAELIGQYFESPAVKLVPIFGWYVAVIYLLIEGPELFTVIGAVLYLISWIVLLVLAVRMRCVGEYYEDALKFAEDYEEALATRKSGQTVTVIGKKKKFGKATVQWKGTGAKALFYRQLLEYKKSRFFIFDFYTLVHLLAGAAIVFVAHTSEEGFGVLAPYVAAGVGAYIVFIFSQINGKWAKELVSPYTYLIPDSAFRKLLYVTMIQNLQNLINGCLICLPVAIYLRFSPVELLFGVLIYLVFASSKVYCYTATEIMVGNVLGTVARQMLMMVLQGLCISVIIGGAFLGYIASGIELSMILAFVFGFAFVAIFAVISTLNFYRLEKA